MPTAGLVRVRNNYRAAGHAHIGKEKHVEQGELELSKRIEKVPFGVSAMDEDESETYGLWNSKSTPTSSHTPASSPATTTSNESSLRNSTAKVLRLGRNPSMSLVTKAEGLKLSFTEHLDGSDDICQSSTRPTKNAPGVGKVTVLPAAADGVVEHDKACLPTPATVDKGPGTQSKQRQRTITHFDQPADAGTIKNPKTAHRTYVIGDISEFLGMRAAKAESNVQDLEALDRMEAHRKFHAAERGQLQRRSRYSIESISPLTPSDTSLQQKKEEHRPVRSITWPITDDEVVVNMTVPRSKPQQRTSPAAMPFRAFVEMHPPPKSCPSAWTRKTQNLMDEKLDSTAGSSDMLATTNSPPNPSSSSSPSSSAFELTCSARQSPSSSISIFSNNARKINAGFEVLPAGTLEKPIPVKDFGTPTAPSPSPTQKQQIIQIGCSDHGKKCRKLQRRSQSGQSGSSG